MYIYIARGPGFESHSGQLSIWNRKTLPQYEYHIYLYIFYIYIYIYIYIYMYILYTSHISKFWQQLHFTIIYWKNRKQKIFL